MDFLAAIVRRYLAWNFREISQNGVRGMQNHSDMPFSRQEADQPNGWSCAGTTRSLASEALLPWSHSFPFLFATAWISWSPKNPKLLNGCIILLCIRYQSSSAETNGPLFFPGAPESRWQPKTLSRCSMFSLASLATRFGDLLGVIFFLAKQEFVSEGQLHEGMRG